MVLRSDITIEAEEQLDAGRIRLHCKRGDAFLAGAHVKIGAVGMAAMKTASTDLRGIASADGLIGPATAIVQQGAQFAFYRGSGVHQPGVYRPTPTPPVPQPDAAAPTAGQRFDALENNLRYNNDNRGRQIHWLEENVLQKDQRGVEVYKTK